MWGIMDAIPKAFAAQYNRPITARELDRIARNSLSLITRLAAGNRALAITLLDALTDGDTNLGPAPLKIPAFAISDAGDASDLYITKEALEAAEYYGEKITDIEPDEDTVGCPALHARGESGSVVEEMWEWTLELARRAYYPKIEAMHLAGEMPKLAAA
jgi:hypothetical protein